MAQDCILLEFPNLGLELLLIVQMLILSDPQAVSAELPQYHIYVDGQ